MKDTQSLKESEVANVESETILYSGEENIKMSLSLCVVVVNLYATKCGRLKSNFHISILKYFSSLYDKTAVI